MRSTTTIVIVAALGASTGAAADGVADRVTKKAARCRSDATALRTQATACRQAIADGRTCDVKVGDSTRLSPDDAEHKAGSFEANAIQLDRAIPGLAKLDGLVASDQDAIRAIGFDTTVEQLDTWTKLGKARQCELIKGSIDAALTVAFTGAAESMKTLTPARAKELVKRWRKLLKKAPRLKQAADEVGLFALVTELGAMKKADEKVALAAASAVLALKTKALDLYACSATATGFKDTEAWVNETADWVGSLVPDARARLAVLGVRLANNAVHAWGEAILMADDVDRLSQLSADQLKTLQKLTRLLEKHVGDRASLLGTLAPCQLGG